MARRINRKGLERQSQMMQISVAFLDPGLTIVRELENALLTLHVTHQIWRL